MTIVVLAAPTPTGFPSAKRPGNSNSTSTHVIEFLANLVKHDHENANALIAMTARVVTKDKHHAPYPICVDRVSSSSDRSMLFSKRSDCTTNGWETNLISRSLFPVPVRPTTSLLVPWQKLQSCNILTSRPLKLSKNSQHASDATRDECKNLVSSSQRRVVRLSDHVVTLVELVIKKQVYAAVNAAEKSAINPGHVRITLQESMRTAQPATVSWLNCEDHCI
ncbi:hypothetical protein BGZ97_003010 [Linnemannia gamsii]|uniref:Uncharacterized protein n=1 Tax=Linnemannia gamsii TaxID=64522 RepID=A0A9P6RJ60_9FUNG|nr:hypothetical protein BGZ97_003010 [Linnemannia gamsii]